MCMIQQWKGLQLLEFTCINEKENVGKKAISLQKVQLTKVLENACWNTPQVVVRQIPVDYNGTEERISLCPLTWIRFAKKHVMRRLIL